MRLLTSSELLHINEWLREKYGYFSTDQQKYRVMWANNKYTEKRKGTFEDRTPEGLFIREFTGVREVRKYGYINEKYVLERCFGVPENNEELVSKTSYEPLWTFQDKFGNALLPDIEVCYYLIEQIHSAENRALGIKYQDPFDDPKIADEVKRDRKKKIYEALYGHITPIVDALDYGSAVSIGNTDMLEKEGV